MSRPRVLMIGLDAAEPALVERWMDDGTLPHLAGLRARGSYRRLASSAAWLAGSPWPTFYTGTSPASHGFYHFLQWDPERMAMVRPGPDWLPVRPFWRALGASGPRCLVIDAPSTYPPEPFAGTEISGWASHDHLAPPAAYPAAALTELRRRCGRSPLGEETMGLQTMRALLALGHQLQRSTACVTDAALGLMQQTPWDLCLVAFAATHRAGHKLWDASGARGQVAPADHGRAFDALREVYRACDLAVGRLAAAAGPQVRLLVFSLHGMGPNTSRAELLPAMLEAVLQGRVPSAPEPWPALQRLRRALPVEFRHALKQRLPLAGQDRLTRFWRTRPRGRAPSPAFCLQADQQGYLRLNQRQRERPGLVAPGAESEALLARIAAGLQSFRDADRGTPVVASLEPGSQSPTSARRRALLPDLVVHWADSPAAGHRALHSDPFGTIAWPSPGRNPDGRAGNHRGEGFLIASGGDLPASRDQTGADIRDLAPTVCAWLGVPLPWPMEGRPLAAPASAGARPSDGRAAEAEPRRSAALAE